MARLRAALPIPTGSGSGSVTWTSMARGVAGLVRAPDTTGADLDALAVVLPNAIADVRRRHMLALRTAGPSTPESRTVRPGKSRLTTAAEIAPILGLLVAILAVVLALRPTAPPQQAAPGVVESQRPVPTQCAVEGHTARATARPNGGARRPACCVTSRSDVLSRAPGRRRARPGTARRLHAGRRAASAPARREAAEPRRDHQDGLRRRERRPAHRRAWARPASAARAPQPAQPGRADGGGAAPARDLQQLPRARRRQPEGRLRHPVRAQHRRRTATTPSARARSPAPSTSPIADDGSGHRNVTLMVQIPATLNRDRPCIVTATSSGSRGVYGAIGTAGEWGLKRGCAVAYTDKGTGTGVHDLATEHGQPAERRCAPTRHAAGADSNFTAALTAPERGVQLAAFPNRVAFKHAHSQQNPEKDWGSDTLDAVRFAFYVLNEERGERASRRRPRAVYGADNTIVIASSVSNGGGAALAAAEQDTESLIDGVAVAEPVLAARPGAGAHGPARRQRAGQRPPAVRLLHAREPLPAVRGAVGRAPARTACRPCCPCRRSPTQPLRGAAGPRAAHHDHARRAGRRVARHAARRGLRSRSRTRSRRRTSRCAYRRRSLRLRQRLRPLRRAGQPVRPVVSPASTQPAAPAPLPAARWRSSSAPATACRRRAASRSSTTSASGGALENTRRVTPSTGVAGLQRRRRDLPAQPVDGHRRRRARACAPASTRCCAPATCAASRRSSSPAAPTR